MREKLIRLTTRSGDIIEINAVTEEATVILLGVMKILESPKFETGITVTYGGEEVVSVMDTIDTDYADSFERLFCEEHEEKKG